MIFKPVSLLNDKQDRMFFLELVNIYIRLVEVFCQKKDIVFCDDNKKADITEMKNIGVITNESDLKLLRDLLDTEYEKFVQAVNFSVQHAKDMGGLLDKLNNKKRENMQNEVAKRKKHSLVDFFCGAGGLSLGFVQQGFDIRLANDIEDVCMETYIYNHPEIPTERIIKCDIKKIIDDIKRYVPKSVDVVVGGPPCQGFSEANRQRVIDDPRNKLYKYFVKAVERIAPKFVVMENVKGMLKVAHQVVEDYAKLLTEDGYTYTVAYRVLNSQNFSVAQSRERLIYIAIRSDVAKAKHITPEHLFDLIEENCRENKIFTLAEALLDIKELQAPRVKNMNEVDSELTGKKIDVNYDVENNNEYLKLINLGRKIPYLFNHKARYCSAVNYEIYKRLNQGDDATNEKIKDIMPYARRNHCFKDKYYKLIADKPCRTITAHLRMDCHSHIHPFQVRSLTPREAARVQSFPDDYFFLGAYLKTYMQIGNAVPPMMARGIAAVLNKYLD